VNLISSKLNGAAYFIYIYIYIYNSIIGVLNDINIKTQS
jgi:hypothetical protein